MIDPIAVDAGPVAPPQDLARAGQNYWAAAFRRLRRNRIGMASGL
jgi:hypothetical protein